MCVQCILVDGVLCNYCCAALASGLRMHKKISDMRLITLTAHILRGEFLEPSLNARDALCHMIHQSLLDTGVKPKLSQAVADEDESTPPSAKAEGHLVD